MVCESLSSNCIDVKLETEVLDSVSIATASLLKGKKHIKHSTAVTSHVLSKGFTHTELAQLPGSHHPPTLRDRTCRGGDQEGLEETSRSAQALQPHSPPKTAWARSNSVIHMQSKRSFRL